MNEQAERHAGTGGQNGCRDGQLLRPSAARVPGGLAKPRGEDVAAPAQRFGIWGWARRQPRQLRLGRLRLGAVLLHLARKGEQLLHGGKREGGDAVLTHGAAQGGAFDLALPPGGRELPLQALACGLEVGERREGVREPGDEVHR